MDIIMLEVGHMLIQKHYKNQIYKLALIVEKKVIIQINVFINNFIFCFFKYLFFFFK
jgi:hypothetical protein